MQDTQVGAIVLSDSDGRNFAEFQCDEVRVVAAAIRGYIDMISFAEDWVELSRSSFLSPFLFVSFLPLNQE